jgi:hypothetical protein
MIKHISLDMWNTIAIPNLQFSNARNQYLSNTFNIPRDIVDKTVTKVKQLLDNDAEKLGIGRSVDYNYKTLFTYLEIDINYADLYLSKVISDIGDLYQQFPPIVLEDIIQTINDVQQKHNITFSISSNTNYVSGYNVHIFLKSIGINPSFGLYSDIIGYSKPHSFFFHHLKYRVAELHNFTTAYHNILHIGDNEICDGSIREHNIPCCIIKHPNELSNTILNNI